ncbi:MAG: GldG family protein [Candidatus Krumholzibacteria bacterium]|nr:GldG family protein [Candidatus Krumholzibacteria bacterium]
MREAIARVVGIAGVVLLGVGAWLSATRGGPGGERAAMVAAGAALLVVFAVLHAGELVALLRRRTARYGANALLASVAFVTILVLVQAMSLRNRRAFDLTSDARHTLAQQTREVLDALPADLTISAFFRATSPARAAADALLQRYARRSPRVHVEFIDPDRHPDAAERAGARDEDLVVAALSRRRLVGDATEEAITNAIIQVTREREKAIYFVAGHGEKDIQARDRAGYAAARAGLEAQGYAVRALGLLEVALVPDDCAVLVVAGPRRDYLDAEIARIGAYLSGRGAVLFMLDPRIVLPEVEALLTGQGVSVHPTVILEAHDFDDAGGRPFDATVTVVRSYEAHPITRGFDMVTMFPMARPVRLLVEDDEDPFAATRASGQYLAITGPSAWGEVDMESVAAGVASRDGRDIAGPLPVAAVLTRKPGIAARDTTGARSRIVVFGDSDFANNTFYGVLGNADLFNNVVSWLAEDEDLISIRRPRSGGDTIFLTAAQGRLVFALCVVLLPLSPVVAGLAVFVRRRRQ